MCVYVVLVVCCTYVSSFELRCHLVDLALACGEHFEMRSRHDGLHHAHSHYYITQQHVNSQSNNNNNNNNKPVGDVVRSLLTIGNTLLSHIFLQSSSLIHESGSDNPFQRYGHSKFSKMVASRHFGFGLTGSGSIRPAVPKNHAIESNTKSIG